jgi:tight adherence protein B
VVAIVTILFFLVTFLIAALAVLVAWLALHRGEKVAAETPPTLLKEESISTIGIWGSVLERFDFIDMLQRHLDQADLAWSVGRFTVLMLLCGSIGLALPLHWRAPFWLAAPIGVFTAALPYLYLRKRLAKRFRKFEEAFPDALDSLARAMRAGHPFSVGMEVLANESLPPVSTEMRTTAREANLGTSWDIALQNLSRRVPLLEVNMFVSAVQLQSRTGGKLNEVLSSVAETMREATSLKGEVRAMAAQGRLSGMVLTLLPIVIAIIMFVVNPSYLAILYYHPNGKLMIAAAVVCLVLGHLVIRRIVDIPL